MMQFTHKTRLPLERAIEVVEAVLEPTDTVLLFELRRRIQEEAPEAANMLEHTIQVMIHGGYLRRISQGPGQLGYVKTESWDKRDATLLSLRAPKYTLRIRPRSRIHISAQPKTVNQAKQQFGAVGARQLDLFEVR